MGNGRRRDDGSRRIAKRFVLGGIAAGALAAGSLLPTTAAFAADYPVPPVGPTTVTRTTTPTVPTEVEGKTVTKTNTGVKTQVLGAQVTRGSLPFTGGDIAGIAIIGAGAVGVGAVLVHRTRRNRATT